MNSQISSQGEQSPLNNNNGVDWMIVGVDQGHRGLWPIDADLIRPYLDTFEVPDLAWIHQKTRIRRA